MPINEPSCSNAHLPSAVAAGVVALTFRYPRSARRKRESGFFMVSSCQLYCKEVVNSKT